MRSSRGSPLKATNVVLLIICLMYLITYIDRVNIATAAPPMQKELALSSTELGIAISAFAYPYAFFQIAGGWLGDRAGPRMTLLICGTIWSAATVLIGFAQGALSLVLARLLLGIGEGSAFPTATRALASWMPAYRRGFAQGITHSFARFGNAVSPPIVAALIVWISWRGSFIVIGLISFLWVVAWWLYFRDDPRRHARVTPDELAELPPQSPTASGRVPWRPLLRRMLPVTFTDFCYGWTLWVYLSWLPSFFLHEYNLNLKQSALFPACCLRAWSATRSVV